MTAAKFADLTHPSFSARWLTTALDKVFAADARIQEVYFSLWVDSYYDDNTNIEYKGDVAFLVANGEKAVPEEDLDEIPSVRALERTAPILWEFFPIAVSEGEQNASANGDFDLRASRTGFAFSYVDQTGEEHEFHITSEFVDGRWKDRDWIVIPSYDGTRSDLLVRDASTILENMDPSTFEMKEMPRSIGASINEDGALIVDLVPGDLTRCMEKR